MTPGTVLALKETETQDNLELRNNAFGIMGNAAARSSNGFGAGIDSAGQQRNVPVDITPDTDNDEDEEDETETDDQVRVLKVVPADVANSNMLREGGQPRQIQKSHEHVGRTMASAIQLGEALPHRVSSAISLLMQENEKESSENFDTSTGSSATDTVSQQIALPSRESSGIRPGKKRGTAALRNGDEAHNGSIQKRSRSSQDNIFDRVKKHPSFRQTTHEAILSELQRLLKAGDAVIRSASRDELTLYWLVHVGIVKMIPLIVENTLNALRIDSKVYYSFETLLERHILPMNKRVQELTCHKRFTNLNEEEVEKKLGTDMKGRDVHSAPSFYFCWSNGQKGDLVLKAAWARSGKRSGTGIRIVPAGFECDDGTVFRRVEELLESFGIDDKRYKDRMTQLCPALLMSDDAESSSKENSSNPENERAEDDGALSRNQTKGGSLTLELPVTHVLGKDQRDGKLSSDNYLRKKSQKKGKDLLKPMVARAKPAAVRRLNHLMGDPEEPSSPARSHSISTAISDSISLSNHVNHDKRITINTTKSEMEGAGSCDGECSRLNDEEANTREATGNSEVLVSTEDQVDSSSGELRKINHSANYGQDIHDNSEILEKASFGIEKQTNAADENEKPPIQRTIFCAGIETETGKNCTENSSTSQEAESPVIASESRDLQCPMLRLQTWLLMNSLGSRSVVEEAKHHGLELVEMEICLTVAIATRLRGAKYKISWIVLFKRFASNESRSFVENKGKAFRPGTKAIAETYVCTKNKIKFRKMKKRFVATLDMDGALGLTQAVIDHLKSASTKDAHVGVYGEASPSSRRNQLNVLKACLRRTGTSVSGQASSTSSVISPVASLMKWLSNHKVTADLMEQAKEAKMTDLEFQLAKLVAIADLTRGDAMDVIEFVRAYGDNEINDYMKRRMKPMASTTTKSKSISSYLRSSVGPHFKAARKHLKGVCIEENPFELTEFYRHFNVKPSLDETTTADKELELNAARTHQNRTRESRGSTERQALDISLNDRKNEMKLSAQKLPLKREYAMKPGYDSDDSWSGYRGKAELQNDGRQVSCEFRLPRGKQSSTVQSSASFCYSTYTPSVQQTIHWKLNIPAKQPPSNTALKNPPHMVLLSKYAEDLERTERTRQLRWRDFRRRFTLEWQKWMDYDSENGILNFNQFYNTWVERWSDFFEQEWVLFERSANNCIQDARSDLEEGQHQSLVVNFNRRRIERFIDFQNRMKLATEEFMKKSEIEQTAHWSCFLKEQQTRLDESDISEKAIRNVHLRDCEKLLVKKVEETRIG